MKLDCDCGAPWDVPCICALSESDATPMKLDTAELILEWVAMAAWDRFNSVLEPHTATAERLAYCVRVTEIVERDNDGTDTYAGMILAEAAKGEGK